MSKVINTIMTILLVLGILGIVLGISTGLYRNDRLAKLQATAGADQDISGQALQKYESGGNVNAITYMLLNGSLPTILLGTGTCLSLISVGVFLLLFTKKIS
jgi:hypothetical protein